MEEVKIVLPDDRNRDGFYRLVADYLPGSDLVKVKSRSGEYSKAFADIKDYEQYKRPTEDGFVVMEKRLTDFFRLF